MTQITLSLFKGYSDVHPIAQSLDSIVEMIRTDATLADRTAKYRYCRQNGWKNEATRTKAGCPCFAVAVCFEGGKKRENITGWTRLCLADFDHLPAGQVKQCMEQIRKDPHTLLAYTTISGEGIRIISSYKPQEGFLFRNETELYKLAFEQMNQYYAGLVSHPSDRQCKNTTRLSGLAHDPEAWYREDALPFEIKPLPEKNPNRKAASAVTRRLPAAVAAIRRKLAAEKVEYTDHHRNKYIMRTGYLLNAYGIPQTEATEWALQQFADYDGDVAGIFRSCYQQTAEHGTLTLPGKKSQTDADKDPAAVADIERFLHSQGRYRKNVLTGKCEMAETGSDEYHNLTDRMVNTLWCRMCKEVRPIRIIDMRCVLESDFAEFYNPFSQYLENLPPWDGKTDHIAALAAQVHVKTGAELFPLFFKKWLVAMIASLTDENVVNHEILVLIGRQGIYKSTWLNNLLPPQLRSYFYLKTNSRNISKDDLLTLSEFAIVCLEELDEMNDRELNQLKALATTLHINERAAYAHYKESRPHIASLCGTGNNLHFLTDLTGNRRWMPFEVESIDSPYEHPLDYPAIYAQAKALAEGGFRYWLEEDEIRRLNEHNRHFEVPCLERDLILTYYQVPSPGECGVFLSNAQILQRINTGLHHKLSPVKIGLVMKQTGFPAVRAGGKRGYRVIELSGEEIEFKKKSMALFTTPPCEEA